MFTSKERRPRRDSGPDRAPEPDAADHSVTHVKGDHGAGLLAHAPPAFSLRGTAGRGTEPSPRSVQQLTVQRAIMIGTDRITHASQALNRLYADEVLPRLEQAGYKTYGIKSKLVEFVRNGNDQQYVDMDDLWRAFHPWLQQQSRRVRGDKETPVLKRFEVSKLSRPAWPKETQERKGFVAGDNIRHVVRNATLKRALEIQFRRVPEQSRKDYFGKLAGRLGIVLSQTASIDAIVAQVYHVLYLNVDNLFSGEGPTNQVIGFAADKVHQYGEELLADGETPVDMVVVYKRVMELIYGQAAKIKADPGQMQWILSNIAETVLEALKSVLPNPNVDVMASSEAAGDIVANIGLNFGFDLIDGRVAEDQQGIGERQARLLAVEVALQGFIASDGEQGDLDAIFSKFLGR